MECDRKWRGIGMIPMSGWRLRPEFDAFNAENVSMWNEITADESPLCIAGQILQGLKKPHDCSSLWPKECTPERPLGATMVSSEGACAAYYRSLFLIKRKNEQTFWKLCLNERTSWVGCFMPGQ
jgi:hydrogenase expression/formation protein HypD